MDLWEIVSENATQIFGFAEFMLAFRCGAGDEVGGHLRLLDGISFLFYFFVWDAKGEGGLDICQRGWYSIFIMKIYEKGGSRVTLATSRA